METGPGTAGEGGCRGGVGGGGGWQRPAAGRRRAGAARGDSGGAAPLRVPRDGAACRCPTPRGGSGADTPNTGGTCRCRGVPGPNGAGRGSRGAVRCGGGGGTAVAPRGVWRRGRGGKSRWRRGPARWRKGPPRGRRPTSGAAPAPGSGLGEQLLSGGGACAEGCPGGPPPTAGRCGVGRVGAELRRCPRCGPAAPGGRGRARGARRRRRRRRDRSGASCREGRAELRRRVRSLHPDRRSQGSPRLLARAQPSGKGTVYALSEHPLPRSAVLRRCCGGTAVPASRTAVSRRLSARPRLRAAGPGCSPCRARRGPFNVSLQIFPSPSVPFSLPVPLKTRSCRGDSAMLAVVQQLYFAVADVQQTLFYSTRGRIFFIFLSLFLFFFFPLFPPNSSRRVSIITRGAAVSLKQLKQMR